jgi:uncharacterized protein
MHYIKRVLEQKLERYLHRFSVVGITGPRQSGKSTLLKHLLIKKYRYISFDKGSNRDLFYSDPTRFMTTYDNNVIFDEAQKVPELFEYIKDAVDEDRKNYGKYIITGSAQFSFIKKITESLAGRVGLLTLLPFQYAEMPEKNRVESIFKGSYPEPVTLNYLDNYDWYSSYVDTYLERDVRTISDVGDLRDFKKFIGLLAANTSQILNMSRYANDVGVAVSTIKRWVSVLEASYIIFLLPPYFKNYGKRITKSPKVYFYDTGLVSYFTGIRNQELFEAGPMKGAIFENYVIAEIVKKETHIKSQADFYYYRTSVGEEVDLVIDYKTHRELIEIKFNSTFNSRMIKQIKKILEKGDRGFLLYNGKSTSYGDDLKISNYKDYLI